MRLAQRPCGSAGPLPPPRRRRARVRARRRRRGEVDPHWRANLVLNILRAVHASGALLPGDPPPQENSGRAWTGPGGAGNGGLLWPNQLRYSPSSTAASSAGAARMVSQRAPVIFMKAFLVNHCISELLLPSCP